MKWRIIMKRKNDKKKLAVISAVIGTCIFATAAFANYQTANGYDVLKKGVFSLADYKRYELKTSLTFDFDGERISSADMEMQCDTENEVKHSKERSKSFGEAEYVSETWYQDGKFIFGDCDSNFYQGYNSTFYGENPIVPTFSQNEKTNARVMKFVELLADTFVGDLRNNFICVEDGENEDVYEISLSAIQIPELANAGLSALFAVQNETYSERNLDDADDSDMVFIKMGDDPYVENAKCRFTVDGENRLKNVDINILFVGADENGARHEMSVGMSGEIHDIDSVQKLDTDSVKVRFIDDEPEATEEEYED